MARSLDVPADIKSVPPWNGLLPVVESRVVLIDTASGCSEHRLVEIFSSSGPFRAYLSWAGGGTANRQAQMVAARGLRVCINARSVKIEVASLHNVQQTISVGVSEVFQDTHNQWEEEFPGDVARTIFIPPFATAFRYETVGAVALAASTIELLDSFGATIASYLGNAQVDRNPLGAAAAIKVTPSAARWRVVFDLSL